MTAQTGALLPLVGADLDVPLADGSLRRYVNLDAAASTSALEAVRVTVEAALGWYASVHRGTGFVSQVSTGWYEDARREVREFVGGSDEHVVIFTRNTTEALNIAAQTLPLADDRAVLTTLVEHHANLLPWRRSGKVVALDPPLGRAQLLDQLRDAVTNERIGILAMTGASNVTGEVFPVPEMAQIAREAGALFCLDAAQLAPHRPIDMAAWGVDALALSGHKMHAPYGSGALIVRRDLVNEAEPLLAGGGAVDFVSDHDVWWTGAPDRHEAGSPNVLGAIALATACRVLSGVGMDTVAVHERALLEMLEAGLDEIPSVRRYRLWPESGADRLGVCTFNMEPYPHRLLAVALSAEYGIGVRDGCFCAHPYMVRLLHVGRDEADRLRDELRAGHHNGVPGAVRASFSAGSTPADVEALIAALAEIAAHGPRLRYDEDAVTGDFTPNGDRRAVPPLADLWTTF